MTIRSIGLLVLLSVAMLTASCAKVVVVKVDEATPTDGMIYALPNTVLRLQIKLDRTVRTRAHFVAYAPIFAPEGDVVCKDADCRTEGEIEYSLQQGATITTYGEPDPQNVYLVKFTGGTALDQTLSMTWNEAGLLSSAGAAVTNRSADIAMSGLKMVATLGTKGAFGSPEVSAKTPACPKPSKADARFIPAILGLGGEAGRVVLRNYCEMKSEEREALPFDDFPNALRAFVDQVAFLINSRRSILEGSSPVVAPAELLDRIDAEIGRQLARLYLGVKNVKTWEGTIDVRAIDEKKMSVVVLRVAKAAGFCVPDAQIAKDSKPLPDKFVLLKGADCDGAPPIDLAVHYHPEKKQQLIEKISDDIEGARSFRYRVPAQVAAEIKDNSGKTYGAAVLSVAQLGKVVSLPAARRSKSLSYELAFIEATGGLKSFKLGSTGGLETGTIDALSSVGGTVLDYENARKAGKDELAILTREAALLKLRDEICTIQQKYGMACTEQPK